MLIGSILHSIASTKIMLQSFKNLCCIKIPLYMKKQKPHSSFVRLHCSDARLLFVTFLYVRGEGQKIPL